MRKIFRVADNPFDDIEITAGRLATFADDAAAKLEADYPAEAAEVKRCALAVQQGRSGVMGAEAERSTGTSVLDAFLADVATFMRKSQPRIAVDLGEDSHEFAVLYPNGRRTYARLTKTDAPAHFLTIKSSIAATGDRLHQPTRERLLGLHDEWMRLRSGQQRSEGDVGEHRNERNAARIALEDALFEALLQVARANKRNPAAARRYFDHALLNAARHMSREGAADSAS